MNLEFDTNIIRKNKFELLDCQVDLILKSLEMYSYMYDFICPRGGKYATKEDDLRISLVHDTYEQIINEYSDSRIKNPVLPTEFKVHEKFFKKVS